MKCGILQIQFLTKDLEKEASESFVIGSQLGGNLRIFPALRYYFKAEACLECCQPVLDSLFEMLNELLSEVFTWQVIGFLVSQNRLITLAFHDSRNDCVFVPEIVIDMARTHLGLLRDFCDPCLVKPFIDKTHHRRIQDLVATDSMPSTRFRFIVVLQVQVIYSDDA